MRIALYTLGCKVNQYESQAMEALLLARGHHLVPFTDQADVYLINSCTVTATSDKKSRQAVRQARKRAPGALVALCGCYPQVSPEAAKELEADLIGGSGDRQAFLDLIEQVAVQREKTVALDNPFHRAGFEPLPAGGLEGRTRGMLKVEDGCTNFCAYCIIPYARGAVRSLAPEGAVAQAKTLEAAGYQEIVVTGIELSGYGRDLPGRPGLADLVEAVCRAVPGLRVRLGSLEPRTVTEDFCRRLAALPNLCPHFHLSLQSGCDATLKRMNRKYDTARYLESCTLLRRYFDDPAITTDLITGFPGETEGEFEQTLAFIREAGFSAMHVFPYSRRTGTPACDMPGQVPMQEKEARAHRAAAVAGEMEQAYLDRQLGKTVPVLFEEEKDGLWRGHTPNYLEVCAESGENLHNQLRQVALTEISGTCLIGKLVEA